MSWGTNPARRIPASVVCEPWPRKPAPSPTCRSEPVYGPDDLAGFDPATAARRAGQLPYTRGVYPSMYTGRPWTMRQYAGFGTAKESNERYHQLVGAAPAG